MIDNFRPLRPQRADGVVHDIETWTLAELERLREALILRQERGFVRECHGDLHLANLVRQSSGIVAFDCIEFDAGLRNIDVCSDVAYLNRYLELNGDYEAMDVYGLYFIYHAMIRAKVAAIRRSELGEINRGARESDEIEEYCETATSWINREPPMLIAMHGFSGTGKTWVSQSLMELLPAIRIRSDVERKRLFGLDQMSSSHSTIASGIYDRSASNATYARFCELVTKD